jgi:hypothetical protein
MDAAAPHGLTTLPSSRPVAQTAARLAALLAEAGVRLLAKVETPLHHTLLLANGDPPLRVLVY